MRETHTNKLDQAAILYFCPDSLTRVTRLDPFDAHELTLDSGAPPLP